MGLCSYWLFGLRRPSTGAHRLLSGARSKRWLLGELNSHLWVLSRMSASSICDPTVTSHLPRDALRPAGKSGPGSYEVTGFSLGWECTRTGVHLQEWSFCSPPSGGVLWRQPCWPSKPHAVEAPPDTSPPGWGVRCGAPHSHSCGRTSAIQSSSSWWSLTW